MTTKSKDKEGSVMFGYTVPLSKHEHFHEDDGQKWGSWRSEASWSCERAVQKVTKYPDVSSVFDLPSGSNALVVWVQWGSGNSFGCADGESAEAIGIFKDMESATSLRTQIEQWSRGARLDDNQNGYRFVTPDGQIFISSYAPWIGYFERLESVNVDVVTIF